MEQLSATRGELIARRLQIDRDRSYLVFADEFERRLVDQGGHRRTIEETLDVAWQLLRGLPAADLKRLSPERVARYGQAPDPK